MRSMARGGALTAMFAGLLCATGAAQQPAVEDLRQAPANRQVKAVGYCGGQYTISFVDGSSRTFGERDVRFPTDSSPLGPVALRPVLVPTGRVGDRALVVFVGPRDIIAMIRAIC